MIQSGKGIEFAVVLCTHNGEKYIGQQLESIVAQSTMPNTISIHDWNSTDRTLSIVREFARRDHCGLTVKIYEHLTADGPKVSFVRAIEASLEADGDGYTLLCDQDDIWHSNKIESFLGFLNSKSEHDWPSVMFSDARIVDASGCVVAESFYAGYSPFRPPHACSDPSLVLVNPCIGMTMCVANAFLRRIIGELQRPWIMHDWGILLLAVMHDERVAFLSMPLVDYRQHSTNQLGASRRGRSWVRIKKARHHFNLLRRQIEALDGVSEAANLHLFKCILKGGVLQRFFLARASVFSKLLRVREGWLLGIAITLFW